MIKIPTLIQCDKCPEQKLLSLPLSEEVYYGNPHKARLVDLLNFNSKELKDWLFQGNNTAYCPECKKELKKPNTGAI